MKVDDDTKQERMKAQKEAQKRVEEKKAQDRANRLKELEEEKERAMLKAAKSKK